MTLSYSISSTEDSLSSSNERSETKSCMIRLFSNLEFEKARSAAVFLQEARSQQATKALKHIQETTVQP